MRIVSAGPPVTASPLSASGAGALVSSEAPSTYAECEAFDEGILMSIRSHLKNEKFNKFAPFLAALEHKDSVIIMN